MSKDEDIKDVELEEENIEQDDENQEEEVISEDIEQKDNEKESDNSTVTQEEYNLLNEEFEKVKNSYQRLLADFENHKRRTAEENLLERTKGKEEVLKPMLDIVDNFDRALLFDVGTDEFKKGIEMVHNMLGERLASVGLSEVDSNGELNSDIHMAVSTDSVDDVEDNHITETLQKGYYVDDKLIRPAMVKVNKKDK